MWYVVLVYLKSVTYKISNVLKSVVAIKFKKCCVGGEVCEVREVCSPSYPLRPYNKFLENYISSAIYTYSIVEII